MINFLSTVYAILAGYGVYSAQYGSALLSVFMALFVFYGGRKLDRQDQEWESNPINGRTPPDIMHILDGCQCMDGLRNQNKIVD
jgi:hypothetical protein